MKWFVRTAVILLGFCWTQLSHAGEMPRAKALKPLPQEQLSASELRLSTWFEENSRHLGLDLESKMENSRNPKPQPKSALLAASIPAKAAVPEPVSREVISPISAAEQISQTLKFLKKSSARKTQDFSKNCQSFASEKGFGTWGKAVIVELERGNGKSMLEGTEDLIQNCPNYEALSMQERSYVWVHILATLAALESACRPDSGISEEVMAVNGPAAGLYQFRLNMEASQGGRCKNGDSHSPLRSIHCAISMIENTVTKTKALFSDASYWGLFVPRGDLIQTSAGKRERRYLYLDVVHSITDLPFCKRTSEVVAYGNEG